MGKMSSAIDDSARDFIAAQHMFFVATAPLAAAGHINLSPKGLDTFRILSPNTVAYLDFNGSGVETIAHIKENGRIILMFCAFEGPPHILRLYGNGRVVEPRLALFATLLTHFPPHQHPRSIIVVELERVTASCGYGVPFFEYQGERPQLVKWARKKGTEGLQSYRERKNKRSLDDLPGITT